MNFNWSISTKTALTLTLLASATMTANAKEVSENSATAEMSSEQAKVAQLEDVDLHLDSLDADGHLSLLESEEYSSKEYMEVAAKDSGADTYSKVEAKENLVKGSGDKSHGVLAAAKKSLVGYHGTETKTKVALDSYGKDRGTASPIKLAAAPADDSHGKDHGGSASKDDGFLSKHTTEIEFTFAILVIVVGLIASEKFQRAQEQSQLATSEAGESSFASIEDSPDYQDLTKVG